MRIKRFVTVLVVTLLVFSTGCSKNGSPSKPDGVKSEADSLSVSSGEAESPVSSTPAMDFTDNAEFHRDILVNFGADIKTGTDGKQLKAHNGAILFQREDWDSEHPMPSFDYFGWNFGQLWNDGSYKYVGYTTEGDR